MTHMIISMRHLTGVHYLNGIIVMSSYSLRLSCSLHHWIIICFAGCIPSSPLQGTTLMATTATTTIVDPLITSPPLKKVKVKKANKGDDEQPIGEPSAIHQLAARYFPSAIPSTVPSSSSCATMCTWHRNDVVPFSYQAGGHGDVLISRDARYVFKPIIDGIKGQVEKGFYALINRWQPSPALPSGGDGDDDATNKDIDTTIGLTANDAVMIASLRTFTPRFINCVRLVDAATLSPVVPLHDSSNREYIQMANVIHGYTNPSICKYAMPPRILCV